MRRPSKPHRGRRQRAAAQYQSLEPRNLLAGDVIISEFVASNNGSFVDAYEQSPDWIELYNRGDAAVDLLGFHLTDDPNDQIGWTFNTSSVIQPGEYQVVFASSRNEIDPAGYFHTDFKLSSGGEYLGLYDSDLNLLSEFGAGGADYPEQVTDISYGIVQGTLVNRDSIAQYLIPTDGSLETTWFENNFDAVANGFIDGRAAIGYENSPGSSTSYVGEFLTEVPSGTTSVYIRNEFFLDDASSVTDLVLSLKYDDGFGVWLNGQFLFSENATGGFTWNATADTFHNDANALQYQPYALDGSAGAAGNFLDLLVDGKNTLAIHALNESTGSSDFLMSPLLVTNSVVGASGYLDVPTPEQPNGGAAVLGPRIENVTPTSTSIVQGQQTIVTADISQFDFPVDASAVDLHYRVMFGTEITIAMNDNGTNGDAVAGDGTFSAIINSSGVAAGQMVRWYVTAADTDGSVSRAPRFVDPLDSAEYFGAIVVDSSIDTDLPIIQWFIENPSSANTDFGSRASIFYEGTFYDNVQVDIHGQSTRGGAFPKKSYDFDSNSGEKFDIPFIGEASDFNLLTNYADQTKLRHPLAYEVLTEAGIPTLHGAPTMVYQNGSFYGLYDVVEEGDEEYLERVGLDPNGALYKVNNGLNDAYNNVTKKTRNFEDHSDFQNVIDGNALNGTAASIWDFDNLDIAGLINYVAAEAVLSGPDFGHKNMYWYHDTEGTGLWTALPWDQDLTFGHQWNASVSPPYFDNTLYTNLGLNVGLNDLFQRVHNTPVLSEMFFRRVKTLSDQFYGEPGTNVEDSYLYQRMEEIRSLIADETAQDIDRWGIQANFAAAYPFNPSQAIDQLQDVFLETRRSFVNNQNGVPSGQTGTPTILFDDTDFDSSPVSGLQGEEYVRLNNPGSTSVDLSGWSISGGISHTFKAGTVIPAGGSLYVVADVVAFQNRSVGPGAGQQLFIQGNYKGNLSNQGETIELHSNDGTFVDTLTTPNSGLTANQGFLRISEVNYNPADSVADAEYVEFLNTGTATLDLAGVTVTEGPSLPFEFPAGTTLAAGERILIVQDATAFANAYPSVSSDQIVGTYSGKLSNSGENIRVEEPGGEVILQVNYGDNDPWHFGTDGDGQTLQLVDEFSTSLLEVDKPYAWRPSVAINGTPGEAPVVAQNVVINEILAHTDAPVLDSIELFNPTGSSILIGDLYLSDSVNDLLKYQIPTGTTLGPGEYIVFDESHFNPDPTNPGPNDFSLSAAKGDQVYLTAAAGGLPALIFDQVDFGATFNGESLARVPDGTGRFLPSSELTLGAENTTSRVGPLIISEVNYHPELPSSAAIAIDPTIDAKDLEFVEIKNIGVQAVDLSDWRVRGDVDHDFGSGTISGGETIVVVTFDPAAATNVDLLAAFRTHYGIDANVTLVGTDSGDNLGNSFGRVSLQQADESPADDPTLTPFVLADEVVYDDLAPWSTIADGTGSSLNRVASGTAGTLASNWSGGNPTPGDYFSTETAPVLVDLVINDGLAQASYVDRIVITFDGTVDIDADAFEIIQRTDGIGAATSTPVSYNFTCSKDGDTVVTLTFESSTRNSSGALADGNYQLTVDGAKVRRAGTGLTLGADIVFGDTPDEPFYALYGDANGDRIVNVLDLLEFRNTFNASANDANYNASLDYSGEGLINVLDLLQFRNNFGKTLSFA